MNTDNPTDLDYIPPPVTETWRTASERKKADLRVIIKASGSTMLQMGVALKACSEFFGPVVLKFER